MNWKPMGASLIKLVSNSQKETLKIGEKIAASLSHGSVVALEGCLGSGKTCLAKGIAGGLGIKENITSPTYTIISEYQGSLPNGDFVILYHIDAYRLNGDEDFENIGGPDLLNSNEISIIEWSSRIPKSLPLNTVTVFMEITGYSSRLVQIRGMEKL